MASLKFKRRNTGAALVVGTAPLSTGTGGILSGEAVWDNTANILYIGGGDDGSGNSTSIKTVAGTGAFVPFGSVGAANGVAALDASGKVLVSALPASITGALSYQGVWNASTNTPTLTSGAGTKGFFYKVSVVGSSTLDSTSNWNVGDQLHFDGTTWDKIDGPAEAVTTVAGRIGAVVLSNTDISGLGALATASSVNLATQATGTLASAQIGALTGDVTSVAGSYATTIAASTVTNAKLASVGKLVFFSAAATLNAANLGNSIEATGSTAFTLTLPTPVGNSAPITTVTNASTAVLTLSTPAGAFSGYGSAGATLAMPAGATAGIFSDGTNWIVADYSLLPVGNITGLGAGIGTALAAAPTGSGSVVLATSPAFAAIPTAPTATAGTNTTQLSTTAFVAAALAAYSPTSIDGGVV